MKLFLSLLLQVNYDNLYVLGAAIGVLAMMVSYIFYLIALQNTLKLIHPLNRRMEPGKVWLILIPVVNLIWQFLVVSRMADSIQNELQSRGRMSSKRPGYGVGLAYCILFLLIRIPVVGNIALLGWVVCWIVHWVKINEYKKQLQEPFVSNQDSEIFGYGKL